MTPKLFLYIKRTNKHTYLYLLSEGIQIYTISTDSRMLSSFVQNIATTRSITVISYILSYKIKQFGFTEISLIQNNVFHGCVAKILVHLKTFGIVIK